MTRSTAAKSSTRQTSTPRSRGSTSSVGRRLQLENAATRAWARLADAFNRRDWTVHLALTAADGRYEDRRKGLHDKGIARDVWQTVFDAPKGWRLEMEPVAIRGSRLGLTRGRFRDTDYADRPITVEYLTVTGVGDDDLMRRHRDLRSRRHRRRLRGTRRPVPRRRSGRPRAHVVGRQGGLCRVQSTRASRDDAGLGEHRPPARDGIRARRRDPVHPCHVGRHARRQHLHRGRASAEQPRGGRHPRVERDLTTGLRRRVAEYSTS